MEISKIHVCRQIVAPLLPEICSLQFVVIQPSRFWLVSLGDSGLAAAQQCQDVCFEQRAVDFHSFASSVEFHKDGQAHC